MNSSSKKSQAKQVRKTRAQLQQELSETSSSLKQQNSEISECQKELKQARTESDEMKKEIEKFKVTNQKLREDNEKLKTDVSAVKGNSSTKRDETEKMEQDLMEHISAPKEKFRIEVTPGDGDYRTLIVHPLTKDQKIIESLDEKTILKFIAKHLPQSEESGDETMPTSIPYLPSNPAEEETAPGPEVENTTEVKEPLTQSITEKKPIKKKLVSQSLEKKQQAITEMETTRVIEPRSQLKTDKSLIKEVRLQQSNKFLEEGQSLSSRFPFYLSTRLHLPVTPSREDVAVDRATYGIRIVVKEVGKDRLLIAENIADYLIFGETDYKKYITIPRLKAGRYTISIFAILPFARIREQKIIIVEIKN